MLTKTDDKAITYECENHGLNVVILARIPGFNLNIFSVFDDGLHDFEKHRNGDEYFVVQTHHNESFNLSCLMDDPWYKADFFADNIQIWAPHLPMPSEKFPGKISYYQDANKRSRGIRTAVKPGRYLAKYFSDILTQDEIQRYAIEFETVFAPAELKITQDANEIETVYRNGPRSCMSFSDGSFAGHCHPARVYAGPDLAVAYLGDLDAPSARAVVWPDKKIYSRVYGDIERLSDTLEKKEYSKGYLYGARIQKIPVPTRDSYIMPYVDGVDSANDDGDYLVLGPGRLTAQNTSGLADPHSHGSCCYKCEQWCDDNDLFPTMEGNLVCAPCIGENYVMCEDYEEYVYRDHAYALGDGDGYISGRAYEQGNYFRCAYDELIYPGRYRISDNHGDTYHEDNINRVCWYCNYSDEWFPNDDDFVMLSSGRRIAAIYAPGGDKYDYQKTYVDNFIGDDTIITPTVKDTNQTTMLPAAGV